MLTKSARLRAILEQSQKGNELLYLHHALMKEYGWISLEEFKRLPIPTVMDLWNEIQKERKEKNKMVTRNGRIK